MNKNNKEILVANLVIEKANKDNTIDLFAYANGLEAMYDLLSTSNITRQDKSSNIQQDGLLSTEQYELLSDFIKWCFKEKEEVEDNNIECTKHSVHECTSDTKCTSDKNKIKVTKTTKVTKCKCDCKSNCDTDTITEDKISSAIEYVQETYSDVHVTKPYMLLGDVVKLIKILTGKDIDIDTLAKYS